MNGAINPQIAAALQEGLKTTNILSPIGTQVTSSNIMTLFNQLNPAASNYLTANPNTAAIAATSAGSIWNGLTNSLGQGLGNIFNGLTTPLLIAGAVIAAVLVFKK